MAHDLGAPATDAMHSAGDGRASASTIGIVTSTQGVLMPSIAFANLSRAMSVTVALGLAASGCGPSRTTFAGHPSSAPAFDRTGCDPKAVEIADRVIAAGGGRDKWAAAKQIRWSESIVTEADTPPLKLEQAWDRWNGRHHLRLHTPHGDVVVIRSLYDGGGSAFAQAGGPMEKLTQEQTEHALSDARLRWEFDSNLLLIAFLLEAPGVKLTLVGERPGADGEPPLDEIKVAFDPKDQTRRLTYFVLVDRTTNQIVRIEIVKAGDPDTRRIRYKVARWVEVGGLVLPTVFHNIASADALNLYTDITVGEPDDRLYVPVIVPREAPEPVIPARGR